MTQPHIVLKDGLGRLYLWADDPDQQKEETAMTREVVETFEYGTQPVFEVEELVKGYWNVILNRVGESLQVENQHAAKSFAEEHAKLYHRTTRVVKVVPEKRA